jgi:hypothetical protein
MGPTGRQHWGTRSIATAVIAWGLSKVMEFYLMRFREKMAQIAENSALRAGKKLAKSG